jgi:imidazole glycerol-phosphate synthase subunit HisH
MVVIVHYGLGNPGSVVNMLKRIGASAMVSEDLEVIAKAEKIIFPGVGHFDRAMERIHSSELRQVLDNKALKEKVPLLGICLGMQLLTRGSEEGSQSGLGWIPADTKRFRLDPALKLKVPHMGWNQVRVATSSRLTEGFDSEYRFYFVHSYYVSVDDERHSILKAHHGIDFDAGIQNDNIFGVQFHPEKSHRFGMKLLENFVKL